MAHVDRLTSRLPRRKALPASSPIHEIKVKNPRSPSDFETVSARQEDILAIMSTASVYTGFWIDYNRSGVNRYQFLWSDYWTGIVTNTLAVLITTASGPIFEITIGPLSQLRRKISSIWNNDQQDQFEESRSFGDSMGYVLRNLRHVGGGYVNIPLHGPKPRGMKTREAFSTVVMLFILMGLPLLLTIASIVSAGLASNSIALSSSGKCGRYSYQPESSACSVEFLQFERRAEVEAAIYAMNCYGRSANADYCTKLYNQNISYPAGSQVDCPFVGDLIISRFRTMGILVWEIFIELHVGKSGQRGFLENQRIFYWVRNLTVAKPRSFLTDLELILNSIHCSDPGNSNSTFVPLPKFTAGPYPVTLIFISSHSVLYPHTRNDPIFPAQSIARFPPGYEGPIKYFHNSTQARVLGCVDQFLICKSTSGPCWSNANMTNIPEAPQDRTATEEENVVKLLLLALEFSSACGSTQFRGVEALDAQSRLAHMQSQNLNSNQWHVEVEKFFQSSLARIQLNAYDIVRGTAAAFDDYHDILPARYRGICSLVAIRTKSKGSKGSGKLGDCDILAEISKEDLRLTGSG
ncbi:hypothetical protein BGZ60DRAFT_553057 [Tricladium varicosporioides]|nr:hypothetical protein BGZ60DRAFT_553057 [Hymenoscyphus varicosporioides]